jgi:predicted secreted protein
MATDTTEVQKYKVIRSQNDFEIRFYPAVTMVTIDLPTKNYKELARVGFRKLVNYIFGGNQANQKIALTTPVHMNISELASSVSLVIPSSYMPAPTNDLEVIIETTPNQYVAAMRFGGYASDDDIRLYAEKLKDELKANAISYYGNYQFLWYNAPYQIFGRKNEIIVNVDWQPAVGEGNN